MELSRFRTLVSALFLLLACNDSLLASAMCKCNMEVSFAENDLFTYYPKVQVASCQTEGSSPSGFYCSETTFNGRRLAVQFTLKQSADFPSWNLGETRCADTEFSLNYRVVAVPMSYCRQLLDLTTWRPRDDASHEDSLTGLRPVADDPTIRTIEKDVNDFLVIRLAARDCEENIFDDLADFTLAEVDLKEEASGTQEAVALPESQNENVTPTASSDRAFMSRSAQEHSPRGIGELYQGAADTERLSLDPRSTGSLTDSTLSDSVLSESWLIMDL